MRLLLSAGRKLARVAIIDEHGELALSRRIINAPGTFRELFGDPEATHVALELVRQLGVMRTLLAAPRLLGAMRDARRS